MKKNIKGILVVAVVGVGALLAMKLFKKAKPSVSTGGSGTVGGVANTSSLDFRSLSNQLFDAFDGYGTSNDSVLDIFRMLKTDADFDALKAAYGVREISSGRGNIFSSNFEGDLQSTVRDEMTSKEIQSINDILASNNLSRRI